MWNFKTNDKTHFHVWLAVNIPCCTSVSLFTEIHGIQSTIENVNGIFARKINIARYNEYSVNMRIVASVRPSHTFNSIRISCVRICDVSAHSAPNPTHYLLINIHLFNIHIDFFFCHSPFLCSPLVTHHIDYLFYHYITQFIIQSWIFWLLSRDSNA